MPEKWTGALLGKMHNNRVSRRELAAEAMCSRSYVTMILNGERTPPDARERLESAYRRIIDRRKAEKRGRADG